MFPSMGPIHTMSGRVTILFISAGIARGWNRFFSGLIGWSFRRTRIKSDSGHLIYRHERIKQLPYWTTPYSKEMLYIGGYFPDLIEKLLCSVNFTFNFKTFVIVPIQSWLFNPPFGIVMISPCCCPILVVPSALVNENSSLEYVGVAESSALSLISCRNG